MDKANTGEQPARLYRKTQCGDLDKYEYTENCPDYSGTKVIE